MMAVWWYSYDEPDADAFTCLVKRAVNTCCKILTQEYSEFGLE